MGQDVSVSPSINNDAVVLEITDHFIYLGVTITNNLSLDIEIEKGIAKEVAVMAKLSMRVWDNN